MDREELYHNSKKSEKTPRKRGRPSKNKGILKRFALAFDPSTSLALMFEEMEGRTLGPDSLSPADILYRIFEEIKFSLEKARLAVSEAVDSDADLEALGGSRDRPPEELLEGVCTENLLNRLEAQFYANEQMISAFTAYLVQMLVQREGLRARSLLARRRLFDELSETPRYMAIFANRLLASGVTRAEVQNLRKSKVAEVVSILKGISVQDAQALVDAVPYHADLADEEFGASTGSTASSYPVPAEETPGFENVRPSEEAILSPVDAPGDSLEAAPALADDSLSASEPMEDAETTRNGGTDLSSDSVEEPAEDSQSPALPRWSSIDLGPLPYRIVERVACSDDDAMALRYRLPEVDMLKDLASADIELEWANDTMVAMDPMLCNMLLSNWCSREGVTLSKEERLLWFFLLVVLHRPDHAARLIKEGFFHGMLMPVPGGSGTRVRQLISTNPSDEVLSRGVRVVPQEILKG